MARLIVLEAFSRPLATSTPAATARVVGSPSSPFLSTTPPPAASASASPFALHRYRQLFASSADGNSYAQKAATEDLLLTVLYPAPRGTIHWLRRQLRACEVVSTAQFLRGVLPPDPPPHATVDFKMWSRCGAHRVRGAW